MYTYTILMHTGWKRRPHYTTVHSLHPSSTRSKQTTDDDPRGVFLFHNSYETYFLPWVILKLGRSLEQSCECQRPHKGFQ